MKPRYITDTASFRTSVTLGETRESKILEFKQRYGTNEDSRIEFY